MCLPPALQAWYLIEYSGSWTETLEVVPFSDELGYPVKVEVLTCPSILPCLCSTECASGLVSHEIFFWKRPSLGLLGRRVDLNLTHFNSSPLWRHADARTLILACVGREKRTLETHIPQLSG